MAAIPAAGAASIIFVASVVDKTKDFFKDFDVGVDLAAKKAKDAFGGIDFSALGQGLGAVAGVGFGAIAAGALTAGMAVLRFADEAIDALVDVAREAVQVAGRIDELSAVLRVVGRNAGFAEEELEGLVQDIRDVGITADAAYDVVLRMTEAELDLSKAVPLARVALDAAAVSGKGFSETLTRIIHATVTLNPLMLRRMRLLVDIKQAYKDAGLSITEMTSSTNIHAKQDAVLHAVIKRGERIVGAYAASLGTAAGQAKLLTRNMNDLEVELGKLFQPARLEWLRFQNELLVEATAWFIENEYAVMALAESLGDLTSKGIAALELLIQIGSVVGGAFADVASAISNIVSGIGNFVGVMAQAVALASRWGEEIGAEEMQERWENLGTTVAQVAAFMSTAFLVGLKIMVDATATSADMMVESFLRAALKIGRTLGVDVSGLERAFIDVMIRKAERFGGRITDYQETLREFAGETMQIFMQLFGLTDKTGESAEEAGGKVRNMMDEIADATRDAIDRIAELNEKFADDWVKLLIRWSRQLIEAQIRESRRREDLLRNHLKRIDKVWYNYNKRKRDILRDMAEDEKELHDDFSKKRFDAAKDLADDLIDIEIDYRRTLEDIQRRFEEDVAEAARGNDAVSVARLFRKRKRDLNEAAMGRDRNIEDAKRDYDRELRDLEEYQKERRERQKKDRDNRLRDLEEDLAEQLRLAEEQRQEDLDNLDRYLIRADEDRTRHRDWNEEDLRLRYQKELEELGAHLGDLEFMNEESLRWLLERHGQFMTDDLALWDAYYTARRRAAEGAWAGTGEVGGKPARPKRGGTGGAEAPPKFARGGVGLVTKPTQIMIDEDQPEIFAAIPLNATVTHNINLNGNLNINGVSPQMEQQVAPAVMALLQQFGQQLLTGAG